MTERSYPNDATKERCTGEHAWKRPSFDKVRSWRENTKSIVLYQCSACSAWGWAPRKSPERVRAYVGDRFQRWLPKREPQPTAVPDVEREAAGRPGKYVSRADVDRRTDAPVLRGRAKKSDYVPTHTLDDWDKEPRR